MSLLEEVDLLKGIFTDSEIVFDGKKRELALLLVPHPVLPMEDERNAVAVRIRLSFDNKYPEASSPSWEITERKNFNQARIKAFDALLAQVLETNFGFGCLFDLHSTLTEWLKDNNSRIMSMHEAALAGIKTEAAPLIQADINFEVEDESEDSSDDFNNEPPKLADKNLVAPDHRVEESVFMHWRDAFRAEMVGKGEWLDLDAEDSKPTGKMIFTNGLLSKREIVEDVPEGANTEVFWSNEQIFEDDDEDDASFELSD